jgi:hypothetical protein
MNKHGAENDRPMSKAEEVTNAVRRIETDENSIAPAEHTIQELRSELEDVEDTDELNQVLEAESEGKDRKGAANAVKARLSDLVNDEEEEEQPAYEHREPEVSEDGAGDVKKLCFARMLADEMGCEREIQMGVNRTDEEVDAFTDGEEYIALTTSAMDRGYYISWTQQIFRHIISMWAFNSDSRETERDGSNTTRYVRYLERHEDSLLDICDEFWMNSTNGTLKDAGYHPEQIVQE